MRQSIDNHLTFDQALAAGQQPTTNCPCWHAGYGTLLGLSRDQVQHPAQFDSGAQSAMDEVLDL